MARFGFEVLQKSLGMSRGLPACAEVKLSLPSARIWVQSKTSTKVQLSKRVVLTVKG
jgi:hypothetical protein